MAENLAVPVLASQLTNHGKSGLALIIFISIGLHSQNGLGLTFKSLNLVVPGSPMTNRRYVSYLSSLDLIKARRDSADRRSSRLELTERGKRHFRALLRALQ